MYYAHSRIQDSKFYYVYVDVTYPLHIFKYYHQPVAYTVPRHLCEVGFSYPWAAGGNAFSACVTALISWYS